MDDVSAGEATLNGVHNRRRRMRDRARSQHNVQSPVSDRYQTPEWLERSFVLPLTQPEASDVPSQTVPHHDDDPEPTQGTAAIQDTVAFVRPPSDAIDFARAVRRADLCRRAGRVAWATAGLAGVALIAYLLVTSAVVLVLLIVLALVSITAFAVRFGLSRAPVPRLRR